MATSFKLNREDYFNTWEVCILIVVNFKINLK